MAAAAALLIVGSGFGDLPGAHAEPGCAGSDRVFAVRAMDGRLAEIAACQDGFGAAVEVDAADWRGYVAIFAARDGDAAVVYAVTPGGQLWWRRQERAGAGLGGAVRVGADLDWNQPVVFASRPGYLQLGRTGSPVLTLRHEAWASGGATVAQQANLLPMMSAPSMSGLGPNFAVETWQGMNFRGWWFYDRWGRFESDVWYVSGLLPTGVDSAAGAGTELYGLDESGGIVLLRQVSGSPSSCPLYDQRPWEITARAAGDYARVVVPVAEDPPGPPAVSMVTSRTKCGLTRVSEPWEWQSGGP
ncbi:hypothetical protein [Actinophytocola sp.]|uniref:hypothetical protein n=1 Tax=Actinophytocola sp. TaxID=1872138 RepID=UPI002D7E908F|nr:hypothetical protein [Actinophytocola sp.]HET9139788.1 hypothetical protein [Actinophytocola sp.]